VDSHATSIAPRPRRCCSTSCRCRARTFARPPTPPPDSFAARRMRCSATATVTKTSCRTEVARIRFSSCRVAAATAGGVRGLVRSATHAARRAPSSGTVRTWMEMRQISSLAAAAASSEPSWPAYRSRVWRSAPARPAWVTCAVAAHRPATGSWMTQIAAQSPIAGPVWKRSPAATPGRSGSSRSAADPSPRTRSRNVDQPKARPALKRTTSHSHRIAGRRRIGIATSAVSTTDIAPSGRAVSQRLRPTAASGGSHASRTAPDWGPDRPAKGPNFSRRHPEYRPFESLIPGSPPPRTRPPLRRRRRRWGRSRRTASAARPPGRGTARTRRCRGGVGRAGLARRPPAAAAYWC